MKKEKGKTIWFTDISGWNVISVGYGDKKMYIDIGFCDDGAVKWKPLLPPEIKPKTKKNSWWTNFINKF